MIDFKSPGAANAYLCLAACHFVRPYVEGRSVAILDGSGTSLESRLLAESASSLTVLYESELAADENHRMGEYQRPTFPKPLYSDGHFGAVVVSGFPETLAEPEALIREAERVLAEDGTLLLFTPDRQTQADGPTTRNAGRQHELYVPELRELLERTFSAVRTYRLGVVAGGLVTADDSDLSALKVDSAGLKGSGPPAGGSMLFVCGPSAAAPEEGPHLILDTEGMVLEEAKEARLEAELLKGEVEQMQQTEVRDFRETVEELRARLKYAETRLEEIEGSRTWRMFGLYRNLRAKLASFRKPG